MWERGRGGDTQRCLPIFKYSVLRLEMKFWKVLFPPYLPALVTLLHHQWPLGPSTKSHYPCPSAPSQTCRVLSHPPIPIPTPTPTPTRRGDPSRVPRGASIRGPESARTKSCLRESLPGLCPRSRTSGLSSAAKTPDHFASESWRLASVGTTARPCPPRSEACVARGAQPSALRRDPLP